MMNRVLFVLIVVLTLTAGHLAGMPRHRAHAASEKYYTFGVVPQFEQRKLYAIWKPIMDALEKETGLKLELVTTLNIQDFEKKTLKGSFDFVYTNPYYVQMASKAQGYIPLVRDKAPLRGVLVVRKDSAMVKPAELNGKIVAFPSPNALGASLLLKCDLEDLYHVTVRPLYVKTHSSVYLHVVQGLAAAGGGVEKTLREQDPAIRDSLRVIYTTRAIPSHPIAVHPRVPKDVREKVRSALLHMGSTPAERELLSQIPVKELVSASMDDYRVLLHWGLERYWIADWKGD